MKPLRFSDPDLFVNGTPYDLLAKMRREQPISWQYASPSPKDGYWLVMRHRDISHISKSTTIFQSQQGTLLVDAPPMPLRKGAWGMVANHLGAQDPPDHTFFRTLVSPSFTPRVIAGLETKFKRVATETVNEVIEKGACDFAEEVALRMPVRVMLGEMLGLPEEDWATIVAWSNTLVGPDDREFTPKPEAAVAALEAMYAYGIRQVQDRRQNPRDDLISVLAHTRTPDGAPLSDHAFSFFWFPLIIGAFDTTASSMSGGALAIVQHPGEWKKVVDDPSLMKTAIDEILRWVSPVLYFRRTAAQDTEVAGQRIKKGDRVVMSYPSGNRDEEVFVNPDVFDVTRSPNPHLAFGFGPHFCLGAKIAEVQVRALYEELRRRIPVMEQAGPVTRVRSAWMNRIKSLPVTFPPGPRVAVEGPSEAATFL